MNFVLKDKNDQTLMTGTKQECMHFIKLNRLNRREVTIEITENKKPAVHYTVPITKDKIKPFYKRIFPSSEE